ncbi:unnamed protein product, partial [marine sediment metagenome]
MKKLLTLIIASAFIFAGLSDVLAFSKGSSPQRVIAKVRNLPPILQGAIIFDDVSVGVIGSTAWSDAYYIGDLTFDGGTARDHANLTCIVAFANTSTAVNAG